MQGTVSAAEERAELQQILESGIFAKAPNLAQLLSYVCEMHFAGRTEEIKEYNIAVEALGRPGSFDQRKDSIVRVEAHRLRRRLKTYYEGEGAGHALRIVVPPGQYAPVFVRASGINLEPESSCAIAPANGHDAPRALEPAAETPAGELLPQEHQAPLLAPPETETPERTRPRLILRLLAAAVLLAAVASGWFWMRRQAAPPLSARAPQDATPLDESEGIRIMAGAPAGRYVDRLGRIWLGDRFFSGGQSFSASGHRVARTSDPELFENRREGAFSYDIPLRPGTYELHLYFAETIFGEDNQAGLGEGARVFHIRANGQDLLQLMDVISDAGGSNLADERVFKDLSPAADGKLHLQFAVSKEAPFLNALEILPAAPHRMRPVRIVAQNQSYRDASGATWMADRYFKGGQTVRRVEPVAGSDPRLFRGERYGNFRYSIPVAYPGSYTVRLHFAETWFGRGRPAEDGPGARLFDVYANGLALLRAFDIYKAAGGTNRSIVKVFTGIPANAQGKLVLSFVPVRNYACLNALEVLDESK